MKQSYLFKSQHAVQSIHFIRHLLRWRLQYYVQVTADVFRRNTQISVLLLLLFGPMLIGLALMLAKPLLALLNGDSLVQSLLIWSGLIVVSILWVVLQRKALMGGLPNQYLQCLPIQPQQRLVVDFCVLFSSNVILFIPYIVALLYSLVDNPNSFLLHSTLILLWMNTVVLLQLQFLYRIRWRIFAAFGSLISPLSLYFIEYQIVGPILAAAYLYMLYLMLKANQQSQMLHLGWSTKLLPLKATYSIRHHLIRIYARQLLQSENHARLILLSLSALLPVIIIPLVDAKIILENFFWIRWKEQQLLFFVISVLMVIPMSLLAGFQLTLKTAYQAQTSFLIRQGITLKQIDQSQNLMLFIVGLAILLPTLITSAWFVENLNALYLLFITILLLWMNIWLYRKPEDLHVVAKIVIFTLNVIAVRLILTL